MDSFLQHWLDNQISKVVKQFGKSERDARILIFEALDTHTIQNDIIQVVNILIESEGMK